KTRAAEQRRQATTSVSQRSGFRARCSRAARTCAHRTTAAATVRPRAMPSRSIRQPVTSDSDVSFARGGRKAMSTEKRRDQAKGATESKDRAVNRRSVLLGSSTLAATAAVGLGSKSPLTVGQAQAQPTTSGQRPNILVLWGDDVGIANVSAYSFGLMGYK